MANPLQPIVYVTAVGVVGATIFIFRHKLWKALSTVWLVLTTILEFFFTHIRIARRHEKNAYYIISAEHLRDWTIKLPLINITFLTNPRSLQDPVEWDDPNLDSAVQGELQEMNSKIFKHIENQYGIPRERNIIRSAVEPGDGEINIAIRVRMPINRDNRILIGQALVRNIDMRHKLPRIFYTEWWNKKRLSP
jgi:predicted membrane protein